MARAELMMSHVRKWEGGYVNDPDDKGGCTNMGITLATYQKYYGKDKTCRSLLFITMAQWVRIFKDGYWNPMKADQIQNQSLAQLCVDMCFMSGTKTTIKKIQGALGLKADGIVGPITLGALNANPKEAFEKLWNMRKEWLEKIAEKGNNKKFLKGWMNRLNACKYEE